MLSALYHYWTKFSRVDPGRIGLPPAQCECAVMPLNYGPSTGTEYLNCAFSSMFGLPGIEPGLQPPHGRVLPVYYSPLVMSRVGPPGIEHGLYAPEAYVLPVYYGPIRNSTFWHNEVPVHLVGIEPTAF